MTTESRKTQEESDTTTSDTVTATESKEGKQAQ